MASLSPLTVVSVALVALAAPACLTESAEAAVMTPVSGGVVVAAPGTIARQVAEIQRRLLGVMGGNGPADDAVDALAHALLTARGTKEGAAPMAALAAALSQVLAKGALAEDELERLAQDLYVASSNRALPDRDAGLLALDVSTLLHDMGAEPSAINAVLTALQRICPGAKVPATVTSPDKTTPAPARRALSVLSRKTDS